MDVKASCNVCWGLENVYVTETRICYIDTANGRIYYRGYDVIELAEKASFEEVAYLLIYGKLPNKYELNEFRKTLINCREIDDDLIEILEKLPVDSYPIDVLRLLIAYHCAKLRIENGCNKSQNLRIGLEILSKAPTILAYFYRISRGLEIIKPKEDLDHVSNFYYMIHGRLPNEIEYKALKSIFIIYADHGMANSTFTAITVASTLTDMCSALISAISSLKGPLHGGANREAIKTLLEIESIDEIENYVKQKLSQKERIMGFGHRVYKGVADPRSSYLREIARELCAVKDRKANYLYTLARKFEDTVTKYLGSKGVYANVDFYASLILYVLEFPPDMNPAIFALARLAGWIAHVLEYWENNRLIRPLDKYVGPVGLKYVSINERE